MHGSTYNDKTLEDPVIIPEVHIQNRKIFIYTVYTQNPVKEGGILPVYKCFIGYWRPIKKKVEAKVSILMDNESKIKKAQSLSFSFFLLWP